YWHYPVLRPKPVATALMRHSNPRMANAFGPHVLFATQYVGAGRSAFLGINTTWRWRGSDERVFNRFWTQSLRFLVEGKLMGGRRGATITTDREQYDVGESVVVTVRALDPKFEPLEMPQLDMQISTAQLGAAPDNDAAPSEDGAAVPGATTKVVLRPISGR